MTSSGTGPAGSFPVGVMAAMPFAVWPWTGVAAVENACGAKRPTAPVTTTTRKKRIFIQNLRSTYSTHTRDGRHLLLALDCSPEPAPPPIFGPKSSLLTDIN